MGKIKAYTYEEYSDLQSRHNELTLKLRKLVEELHTEADDPNLHLLVAHAFKDVADRIEELLKRGE